MRNELLNATLSFMWLCPYELIHRFYCICVVSIGVVHGHHVPVLCKSLPGSKQLTVVLFPQQDVKPAWSFSTYCRSPFQNWRWLVRFMCRQWYQVGNFNLNISFPHYKNSQNQIRLEWLSSSSSISKDNELWFFLKRKR